MAVILSIWTLRIRLVAVPLLGKNVHRLVNDLLRIYETTDLLSFYPTFSTIELPNGTCK